jgi:hypothetical protein
LAKASSGAPNTSSRSSCVGGAVVSSRAGAVGKCPVPLVLQLSGLTVSPEARRQQQQQAVLMSQAGSSVSTSCVRQQATAGSCKGAAQHLGSNSHAALGGCGPVLQQGLAGYVRSLQPGALSAGVLLEGLLVDKAALRFPQVVAVPDATTGLAGRPGGPVRSSSNAGLMGRLNLSQLLSGSGGGDGGRHV